MFGRILREGFVAGLVGAAAVATWFFVVDLIGGNPFYTPSMLGSAVFWSLRDPALVEINFPTVIAYTMLHVMLFALVGMIAASLATVVQKFPSTLFLIVVFFAIFEVGFYIVVATMAAPLLGRLAWSNVAVGNLIAALGMGYYLWTVHPEIRKELMVRPLGETADGE
jgi:hypothetical protein